MVEISVSEYLDLQQDWQSKGGLPKESTDWFYSLKTLKLRDCKFEPYAIPSNVLRCLKSLKELEVGHCDIITGIFEMNDIKIGGTSFQLKKLTLYWLPNVTHVWQKDEQRILNFQNLQEVAITNCENLKSLFPAALAKKLEKLEKLNVKSCRNLQEIVEKQEVAAEGTEKFLFPRLAMLELWRLPQLTHFYSERFTLECPQLNILQVTDCNKFVLFQSQQQPPFLDIEVSKIYRF